MRIAILAAEYPPAWGGVGAHTYYLSKALVQLGHEITVITRPSGGPSAVLPGVEVRYVHPRRIPSFGALLYGQAAVKAVAQERGRWDVLHLMYPLIALPSALFDRLDAPVVATMHGTWHGEREALRGLPWRYMGVNDRAIKVLSPFFERFERTAIQRSKIIVAITEHCAADLVDHYGADRSRLQVISNGVDTTLFRPNPDAAGVLEQRYQLAPGTPIFLCVARLVARKGLPFLLESFHALTARLSGGRAPHLVLVGDGPLLEPLREIVRSNGLQATVHFAGRLPVDQLALHYAGATVCVVPSSWEGQGMTLLESMASGRPGIGTNTGGIPEVITPGKTGFLVPYGDVQALAGALDECVTDRAKADRLGAAAREEAIRRFDWRHIASRLSTVYQEART